jgi:GT2 family glycosyltransferase
MQSPKVSVIIVNFNGKNLLEKCLNSLFKIDYDNFEVILVDNNSTDESVDFITKNYPSIISIKLDLNKGFAEPNNIGSKSAKGEYLLFLNNDTVVTPNFISEMIKVIENNDQIGICQSLLLKANNTVDSSGDFIDGLGVVFSSKKIPNDIEKISSAKGASLLIRKKLFSDLGGFDKKFFATFEDVDLGWRTWILGYSVVIVPKSIVYHIGGQTINQLKSKIAFHGFKNQISMKITNFETKLVLKKLIIFFIKYGFRELKIWMDYSITGTTRLTPTKYEEKIAQKPNFMIILKSLFWIMTNSKYLMKKHHKINSKRVFHTKKLEELGVIFNNILD